MTISVAFERIHHIRKCEMPAVIILASSKRDKSSSRARPVRTLSSVMWGIIPPILHICSPLSLLSTPPKTTLFNVYAITMAIYPAYLYYYDYVHKDEY
jgi:hypothetical protein